MKKKLLKARSLNEEIMTYMTEGLVLTDTRGNIIFINQRLSEMLGYQSEEITGKCWLDIVPDEQQALAREAEARRAKGHTDRYEIFLRRKTGEKIPVLVGAGPRFDRQSGQYVGSMGVVNDITERKHTEEMLKASEAAVRRKLKAILEPESDLGELELADIIDVPAVQSLMEKFYRITGMLSAIVDSSGKVLVEVGWQDICKNFHRCHPETRKNCVESDLFLSSATEPGGFKSYRCKNGMRDMSTPIVVSGLHMGNIYFGQFIYSDEKLDVELFRNQARKYGFDEVEYLAALHRVPRYDREAVEEVMAFYSRLGVMISDLSFSNLRLSRALTEQKRAKEELREKEEKFRLLFNIGVNAMFLVDNNTTQILECNNKASRLFGYTSQKLLSMKMTDLSTTPEETRRACQEKVSKKERVYQKKDGSLISVEITSEHFHLASRAVHISAIRDITYKKNAEKALKESNERLKTIFDSMDAHVYIADMETHEILFSNFHSPRAWGDPIGQKCWRILHKDQDGPCAFCTNDKLLDKDGKSTGVHIWEFQNSISGKWFDCRDVAIPWTDGRMVRMEIATEITKRKQSEAEKEKLQDQLAQAQKMESVGRLAGGVAHDFNNMLGVILGHTELALLKADEKHDLYSDLKEIQNAAKRSADTTKQLLAFARKEIISPKYLDLNDTVESMLNMLRRLIGEDINLVWQPFVNLWTVKMDPSQIDQVLVNLCVNARDAIAGVGKIAIATGQHTFDVEYCNEHPGSIPGDFVLLAISDNGCGMDKKTLEDLFEPFFTTKEVGKGTGLGLATVFGIVKQNNGFINVYSEPGQGSTFEIYLPRLVIHEDTGKVISEKKAAAGGTETILLVEDEPSILRMTRMMLERKGYSVLSAATPSQALEEAEKHSGSIDLLMTDVVMPEMNGRDLSGKISALYPGIRLLFMSGYTANVIAHQGVLDDGVAFIQKPFSMEDMTAKLRGILDGEINFKHY